ncbi:uncharacterized protein LOC134214817 isoform X2 [Armigeres subalbatus]|uniref:uncharacterized protein LOC134214817 isoform X2 n=1 Tax=Armigeres subalbatus TaxID=124917 RepID=UPI002ED0842F
MAFQYGFNSFNYQDYFERSASFLAEHRWIFEQSNTKFVQAGTLDVLPSTWIQDLKRANNDELNAIPLGHVCGDWCDDLKRFLKVVKSLSVEYEQRCDTCSEKPAMAKGISPKKMYEIQNLTSLIGEICDRNETLLDFGSGLGYLSQHINAVHQFRVLGLEGDSYRVQAAHKRQANMFPNSLEKVKYVQHFIQENSFDQIKEALTSAFPDELNPSIAIVGLHACADLSVTAIKMFLFNEYVTKLIIMPCCYHKLAFDEEHCSKFKNFPISQKLKEAKEPHINFIGRPFLRLGCQQTASRWKNMTEEEHISHGLAMFERSLVEALVKPGQTVTKRRSKSGGEDDNLLDKFYLSDASKIGPECDIPWDDTHRNKFEELSKKYPDGGQLAEFLTCLQTCLQYVKTSSYWIECVTSKWRLNTEIYLYDVI